MPVIGTPVIEPATTDISCSSQYKSVVGVTKLFGVDLPTKKRAISINQSRKATVQFQLFNETGNPVDLVDCGVGIQDVDTGTVTVKIREVISTRNNDLFSVTGSVVDASIGLIEFEIPTTVVNNPGVYNCEVGIVDNEMALVFSNHFYIWINRGLFGNPKYPNAGPPSLDNIRLYIRDNAPEENLLLDDFEFDLAEVCQATELGVRYWNETQPPINVFYSTITYCARERWLQFIAGQLLIMASFRFRRNHLPYQAGGLAVDDQNKFGIYEQTGLRLVADYREWVKQKKTEINCMMAISSHGSSYGSLAYSMINSGL